MIFPFLTCLKNSTGKKTQAASWRCLKITWAGTQYSPFNLLASHSQHNSLGAKAG